MRVLRSLAGALVIAASHAHAQEIHGNLRIDPAKLYPEMIRMTERSDWDNLTRATELLQPMLAEIDAANGAQPGRTLREQIAAHNSSAVLISITRCATLGAALLLRRSRTTGPVTERRALVRASFTEFLTISAMLSASNFRLGQAIDRSYRNVNALAGLSVDRFSVGVDELLALLGQVPAGEASAR